MGRATIKGEIARLEERSRSRMLTEDESVSLQRLIATERRYDQQSWLYAERVRLG